MDGGPCTAPTFLNDQTIVLDASCGKSDGNISIIPQTGVAPFMYSIDGGTTYVAGPNAGYTFTGLAAGFYNLKLKDANGCESAVVQREVKAVYNCSPACTAPTFINDQTIVLDASCGADDGNISIIPTSGTAPFMYSIDGGVTYVSGPNGGYTFDSLAVGMYNLRLKDANGCESAVVQREVKPVYGCPPSLAGVSASNQLTKSGLSSGKESLLAYPNPSKGAIKVQLLNFVSRKAEVSIFDAKGTLVQKSPLNLNQSNIANFDLSNKAPGLYYIKIMSNTGTQVSKVVVQ